MAVRRLLTSTSLFSLRFRTSGTTYCVVRHLSREVKIPEECNENGESSDIVLSPFATVTEKQKHFLNELIPPAKRSFNLAAYVNTSKTLQELIKLGVSLYDIENTNYEAARYLAQLNFEKDCLPYITLLCDYGLKGENIGRFISEYPNIFQLDIDDLQTRFNYLESKRFSKKQIAKSLNRSSEMMRHSTKTLDFKLGQLQIEFKLPADILRKMVSSHPQIVSLPYGQYRMVNFVLFEELGFKTNEIHKILLGQPEVIDIQRAVLFERLDLIHNRVGLSHEAIVKFPKLITGPILEITHRSGYLKKLKRDQYDPKQPLYVPPSALYNFDDETFCTTYAKTNLDDYKLYVKSC